jgi:hypothetical protein
MSNHRAGRFHEQERDIRDVNIMFGSMGSIISPDTDDFSWLDRWEKLHLVDEPFRFLTSIIVKRTSHELTDLVLGQPPPSGFPLRGTSIAKYSHFEKPQLNSSSVLLIIKRSSTMAEIAIIIWQSLFLA